MNCTVELATEMDKDEILELYNEQKGQEFCPWDEHYPAMQEIDYDLSRESLFIVREAGKIIAAISIDSDEQVEELECWSKNSDAIPAAEISRLAVAIDYQNRGIAREMIKQIMQVLKERGYKSIHFLVNKNNLKALKSYNKLDFNVVGECNLYEQPFLCYEKPLGTEFSGNFSVPIGTKKISENER